MSKRKKKEVSDEEQLVIDEFMKGINIISSLTNPQENEVPCIEDLGDEARMQLLQRIHGQLGSEQTQVLIQIMQDSDDADWRCPK